MKKIFVTMVVLAAILGITGCTESDKKADTTTGVDTTCVTETAVDTIETETIAE